MDMTGQYRIPAPRQKVWEALNDVEVLKASLPGCEELDRVSANEFKARMTTKIGAIKATFGGRVLLDSVTPPASYVIRGQGQGGAAGFVKGDAEVRLEEHVGEHGRETVLSYSAKADIGGKLATLGNRVLQGAANRLADDFFGRFAAVLGGGAVDLPLDAAMPAGTASRVDAAEIAPRGHAAPIVHAPATDIRPIAYDDDARRRQFQNRALLVGSVIWLGILLLLFFPS